MLLLKHSTFQFCVIAYIFNVFEKSVMFYCDPSQQKVSDSVSISHLMLSQSLPVKYLKLELLTN